jgi:exosortase
MEPSPYTATSPRPAAAAASRADWILRAGLILSAAVLVWFYAFVPGFGPGRSMSALSWLISSWNGETDYEHGFLFPFIIVGMLAMRWKQLRGATTRGEWLGVAVLVLGAMTFVAAQRTLQPRVAVGGLPITLLGCAWFLWGRRVTLLLAFPLCFLWLAIPLPSFQQATVHLQLLATSLAHHGASLLGVENYTQGTLVLPVKGAWKPLDIASGCSGIRSLMALIMVSSAWAYFAPMSLWKKAILFASAVPLAILGNALRVISIFVIAEYGNAEWAVNTWHDWSGLLLFYPFSLLLMLGLHTLLEGGLPWRHGRSLRKVVVRQHVAANGDTQD